ncbi:unnamed protein product [Trichogramma brassicae]|uniref:Uncharacterized protein n=1 Tax=Trichogramma brassicae TaxID=86971 RepID=A0A6H5I152_9HYME|nr:unnamed protein product [Trichogramma brassicae]
MSSCLRSTSWPQMPKDPLAVSSSTRLPTPPPPPLLLLLAVAVATTTSSNEMVTPPLVPVSSSSAAVVVRMTSSSTALMSSLTQKMAAAQPRLNIRTRSRPRAASSRCLSKIREPRPQYKGIERRKNFSKWTNVANSRAAVYNMRVYTCMKLCACALRCATRAPHHYQLKAAAVAEAMQLGSSSSPRAHAPRAPMQCQPRVPRGRRHRRRPRPRRLRYHAVAAAAAAAAATTMLWLLVSGPTTRGRRNSSNHPRSANTFACTSTAAAASLNAMVLTVAAAYTRTITIIAQAATIARRLSAATIAKIIILIQAAALRAIADSVSVVLVLLSTTWFGSQAAAIQTTAARFYI